MQVFIGSITNRGSNHLPHDSRYEVLILRRYVVNEGEEWYMKSGVKRVQHCTCSSFFYFPTNGSTNPDVFSQKLSALPWESSLNISTHWVYLKELTNRHTHWHPIALEEGLIAKMWSMNDKWKLFIYLICIMNHIQNPSSKAIGCQWVCVFVCVFVP